jgi:hypothetical protein
VASTLIICK